MLDRMKQYLQSLQQITADVDFDELSERAAPEHGRQQCVCAGQKRKTYWLCLRRWLR